MRQKILSAFGSGLLHIVSCINITVAPRRRLMTFCTRKLQPSLTCCPCHSNCLIWRLSFQRHYPPGSALHLSGESSLLPLSSGISASAKVRRISGWSGRPQSGWALREREPPHVFWQMVLNHVRKIKKNVKIMLKKKPRYFCSWRHDTWENRKLFRVWDDWQRWYIWIFLIFRDYWGRFRYGVVLWFCPYRNESFCLTGMCG